eukprot:364955-Chlamydomonas_euryale.AAC.16
MDGPAVGAAPRLDAAEHCLAKRQHLGCVVGVVAAEAVGREQPARHHVAVAWKGCVDGRWAFVEAWVCGE